MSKVYYNSRRDWEDDKGLSHFGWPASEDNDGDGDSGFLSSEKATSSSPVSASRGRSVRTVSSTLQIGLLYVDDNRYGGRETEYSIFQ